MVGGYAERIDRNGNYYCHSDLYKAMDAFCSKSFDKVMVSDDDDDDDDVILRIDPRGVREGGGRSPIIEVPMRRSSPSL